MPNLRCPGPLAALRALAALYGVRTQTLASTLPAIAADAPVDHLPAVVADALGARLRQPDAVHYFHRCALLTPAAALEHGLEPPLDRTWEQLGVLVADRVSTAEWTALRAAVEPSAAFADAMRPDARHGPRGLLLRESALTAGQSPPAPVRAIAVACERALGVDLAARYAEAATPCLVEYRRTSANAERAVAAALAYVAVALGSPREAHASYRDAHRAPLPPGAVVSVRALDSEAEWVR